MLSQRKEARFCLFAEVQADIPDLYTGWSSAFIPVSVDSDDSSYGRDSTLIMCVAGYEAETCIKLL